MANQNSKYINEFPNGPMIPSDSLAVLRPIFEQNVQFATFIQLFQWSIIVDANVVIGDLIWLTKTRKNPNARTALQEVIAAQTVIATAPLWLEEEIQENIPRISEKEKIPIPLLNSAWLDYREQIEFKKCAESADSILNSPDPDDHPYLILQRETEDPIYTQDQHFKAMGAKIIDDPTIITRLRDYSRHEAVELTFLFGQYIVTGIGIEIIKVAWVFIKRLFKTISELPPWVKYLGIALLLVGILNPKSRQFVKSLFEEKDEQKDSLFKDLMNKVSPILDRVNEAKLHSDQILSEVYRQLPDHQ